MASRGGAPVKVGDVVRIEEDDYRYGVGMLVLRVTAIGEELQRFPAIQWVRVRGTPIRWDGREEPEREVLVRASVLRNPHR